MAALASLSAMVVQHIQGDLMNIYSKVAATFSALVLAGSMLSGCAVAIGGTTCEMNVQNPHQSNGSPRYMDAKVTFQCNGLVKNAQVKIKMQKRTGSGGWIDVPNSANSISKSTIQSGQKITLITGGNLLCSNGTYRAVGWGKGTNAQGQTATSPDWYAGNAAQVTCR